MEKTFLAMLLMSFISSSGIVTAAPEQASVYRKFVIFYGWYLDGEGRLGPDLDRIVRSKPEYVISPFYTSSGLVNLSPEVLQRFHDSGIRVMVYIATGNADRSLDGVLGEIKTGLQSGADGVMLDEVASLHYAWQVDYYEAIYDYVKSFGADKVVIANPGSIIVSESVMSVSDIVSFEHQWRLAPAIDWFSRYPAARFMGISSNDIPGVMGYAVDGEAAVRDTVEAWQSGMGYHYATNSYTGLEHWFEDYQKALDDFAVSGSDLNEVTVKTVDTAGGEIKGLWIEVTRNGRVIVTGFSPAKFMLPPGSYEAGALDYQNFVFSKWQSGEATPYKKFLVRDEIAVEMTAIYRNELSELSVASYDNLGNAIKGIKVSVSRNGAPVAEGVTPLHLELPPGSYSVSASSQQYYRFSHWADESKSNTTEIDLPTDRQLAVHYDNLLAEKLGGGIFGCENDYRAHVIDSLLQGGPLAGALELHMRKSIAIAASC
ncbi:MAG: spherulation-specific family 4 protein [Nitrososphaera sp.]|nr:spherulation-specific family 4 protein [Nitrososphaera sp.]